MSATTFSTGRPRPRAGDRQQYRMLALAAETIGCLAILVWTLTPLYCMVEVALEQKDAVSTGACGRCNRRSPAFGPC